jgi:hypothetical protein
LKDGWRAFDLHKKGNTYFNDLAGSLENALTSALRTERESSLVLKDRHGELRLQSLPRTMACLERLRRDTILAQARTVVGPSNGMHNDVNSRSYGDARLNLERVLSEAILTTAAFIRKKRPRPE